MTQPSSEELMMGLGRRSSGSTLVRCSSKLADGLDDDDAGSGGEGQGLQVQEQRGCMYDLATRSKWGMEWIIEQHNEDGRTGCMRRARRRQFSTFLPFFPLVSPRLLEKKINIVMPRAVLLVSLQ